MKTSLFTTLSYFLLLFFTKLLLAHSASPEPVLDVYGSEIKSHLNYYAISFIPGVGGGGLDFDRSVDGLCPFDVIQQSSRLQHGNRIKFSPYDNSTIVSESTDLNVKFSGSNLYCRDPGPLIWQVSNYSISRGKWPITASGTVNQGNPGAQTLLNWFKIERELQIEGLAVYKFVHCPSVCESCAKLCNSLGISFEAGARRLVLVTDDQLPFRFVLIPELLNQLIVN